MKHIFATIGVASMSAMLLMGCQPDEYAAPNGNIPLITDYANNFSVTVDQETNTATFTFKEADGVTPVWNLDGAYSSAISLSKYYRKRGEYSIGCQVKNANGVSDGSTTLKFTIDKTKMNGFAGFDAESSFNLFTNATFAKPVFWYAPGWSQIADPSYSEAKHEYAVTCPAATTDQWQNQMKIGTNVALQAGKHYDFSCILTSTTAQTRGVTVKLCSKNDENNTLYFNGSTKLEANEPLCVYFSNVECKADINDLMVVFDFGGNAANSVFNIESLVIKDHANDDGTVVPTPPAAAFDYNAATNLWLPIDQAKSVQFGGFYAPNWAQIANAVVTQEGDEYTINLPEATFDRWQSQIFMSVPSLVLEANQEYDYSVTVESNNAVNAVAKLTDVSADDIYLDGSDAPFAVPAGGSATFQLAKVKMKGTPTGAKLVFDFGGNPANTVVKVKKIIIQKHKE